MYQYENKIKVFNANALDLLKKLRNESIDLIVTDVPYPTTSRGCAGNSGGMLQKDINKSGKVFKYNDIDCTEYADDFYRVLKDGSHCYVMTNHINLIHMLNTFTGAGFHFIKSLIWNKGNKIMGNTICHNLNIFYFSEKAKELKLIIVELLIY